MDDARMRAMNERAWLIMVSQTLSEQAQRLYGFWGCFPGVSDDAQRTNITRELYAIQQQLESVSMRIKELADADR